MGVIKNFGFLWERKYLYRGKGSNAGHLYGYNKKWPCKDESDSVDFKEQIGIYVLYDSNQIPVYVGQAGGGNNKKLFARIKDHEGDHLWNRWKYFSWFGVRKINDKKPTLAAWDTPDKPLSKISISDIINDFEGILLVGIEPKLNKQGPRWKDGGEEFFQYVDPRLNITGNEQIMEKLCEIEKRITK